MSEDFSNSYEAAPKETVNWLLWFLIAIIGFCLLATIVAAIGAYFYLSPAASTPTEIRLDLFLTQTALAQQLSSPQSPTTEPISPTATMITEPTIPPTSIPTLAPPTEIILSPTQIQVESPTPTSTEDPNGKWEACPGIYLSRLHVGETAFVSTDPPLPNRVRTQPSSNALVIGFIQPGELVDIIEGPSCSNKWIWWRVHSQKTGMTGWTAEGDSENYWLVPVNLEE